MSGVVSVGVAVALLGGWGGVDVGGTVEVWWELPESGWVLEEFADSRGDGWRVGEAGFPQTLIESNGLECGRWAQVDVYPVGAADRFTADGVLTYGEDWEEIVSWRFVYGGDCPVDVPEEPEVSEAPEVPVGELGGEVSENPPTYVREEADLPRLAETGVDLVTVGMVAGFAVLAGFGLFVWRRVRG